MAELAYWPLWGTDDHAVDLIGGNNGALNNFDNLTGDQDLQMRVFCHAWPGSYHHFSPSGPEHRIIVPGSASLQSGQATIMAFVKHDVTSSNDTIFALDATNPTALCIFCGSSNRYGFQVKLAASPSTGRQVYSNNSQQLTTAYRHVAGTYDGTTMRIVIDGTEQNTASHSGAIDTAATGDIGICCYPTAAGYTLDGNVSHVRLFDEALTDAQIQDYIKAPRRRNQGVGVGVAV